MNNTILLLAEEENGVGSLMDSNNGMVQYRVTGGGAGAGSGPGEGGYRVVSSGAGDSDNNPGGGGGGGAANTTALSNVQVRVAPRPLLTSPDPPHVAGRAGEPHQRPVLCDRKPEWCAGQRGPENHRAQVQLLLIDS